MSTPETPVLTEDDKAMIEKVKSLLEEPAKEEDKVPEAPIANPEDVGPETRIETERNTTFDPNVSSQTGQYSWNLGVDGLGDVTVTDIEKSLYLKAVLNDVPVIFPITLDMASADTHVVITVRTLNNYEMDLVFWALEKDRAEGLLTNPSSLATRLQYYAGGLQVTSINNKQLSFLQFPEPGVMEEDGVKLRTFVSKFINKINWPRWQVMLVALRIFEAKTKVCNDAALNGNFWKPQDADS